MATSDQDPSVDPREDAKDDESAPDSSGKGTLLGIGERLRAAREKRKRRSDSDRDDDAPSQPEQVKGTKLGLPRPGDDDAGNPPDPTELGDTPSDANPAHRRTAAMYQDEAQAAASGELLDTGPQTIEMTGDEDEVEFLDDDAILEEEPAGEMESEATMLSDNLFPSNDEDGPDEDYDVGKTEVSIQSLDDLERDAQRGQNRPTGRESSDASSPSRRGTRQPGDRQTRSQQTGQDSEQGRGGRRTAHLDQDRQQELNREQQQHAQQTSRGRDSGRPSPDEKSTRQQFPDTPASSGGHSGSFPEPADTPADRPSRRQNQNPPTPEAGRSGQINRPERADAPNSQPASPQDRSSRSFPKSPTPREDSPPMGDTPDSGVQQPVDGFEDEKTEVFNSPYERETVVPKLSALSGPSSGQEFLLNKMRNSVGRGNNNSVMVPDLAMSRRHFEIAKNPDESFTVRDLQSANGTVVNGTAVKEAELFHGDRIEAGKTTFQFLHPDQQNRADSGSRHIVPAGGTQPSAPMKASSGQNRTVSEDDRTGKVLNYVIIVAMAVSVVLAVPVVYLLFFDDEGAEPQKPTAEALASEGASQDLIALYLEGVNAVKDRDWDTAKKRFEDVKAMDPDFERVNQQLERIRREKANMSRLQKAQSLADDGELGKAGEVAAQIDQNSVYREDAQAIVRRSRRIDVDERYQKAVTAFGEDEFETSMNHVQAVLDQVPEHQGALELKDKLAEAIEQKKEEEEQAKEQEQRDDARASAPSYRRDDRDDDSTDESSGSDGLFDMDGAWSGGGSSSGGSSGSSSGGKADLSKGYTLYKAKNFTAAVAYFNSIARKHSGDDADTAKAAASNVRKFQSAYESANAAYGRGDYGGAISKYKSARSLDKKVSGNGYFQSPIGNKLANAYGKRGLAQLRKGQYSGAYSSYRSGKRYSSSNSTLRTLRQQLTNKARSLYIQAANKRKSDPAQARSLCDTITSMIPPSEPTYQKAKKLQGEL
jgi:tetratricopeptide (TPR) repeat protein